MVEDGSVSDLVLISTNGGSVFYRANNLLANASYSPEGQEPLPKDEFAADKKGYKAADDCGTDGQEASCLPGG